MAECFPKSQVGVGMKGVQGGEVYSTLSILTDRILYYASFTLTQLTNNGPQNAESCPEQHTALIVQSPCVVESCPTPGDNRGSTSPFVSVGETILLWFETIVFMTA